MLKEQRMNEPMAEYQRRRETAEALRDGLTRQSRTIGNVRLLVALLAIGTLWTALSSHRFSAGLTLVPAGVFVALAIRHQAILRRAKAAGRTAAYYIEGLERLKDNWSGHGATGEVFRERDHVFADDLDLFGTGSLFQLISRARTKTGEQTLANWLLKAAGLEAIGARHQAVRELASRLDLREDIGVLGEAVGTSIHGASLKSWAAEPANALPRLLRPTMVVLAVLNAATLAGFLGWRLPLYPLLIVFLANVGLIFFIRHAVAKILSSLETPALDLDVLSRLVERLERERFTAPLLQRLHTDLQMSGVPASKRMARLRRLVELLDSMDHVILRGVNPLLLLREQLAMAVESWRRANGPLVARWLEATGDFEALSSLACLAYERPGWVFPSLLREGPPCFRASAIRHPLIPEARSVPNDVSIGGESALLVVSGSNMSGKSTLLRAIGLNAVLAWSGATVCAGELALSSLQLGASIRVTDSLQDNRSRFFAEITRLRQIVDLTKSGSAVLFLLDELLSGTNSHDRKAGAAAVVRALVRDGAFGLITTHDLALAGIADELPGHAKNVHFEDQMVNGRMEFDYHLREGVVTRSNALELMRAVGLEI